MNTAAMNANKIARIQDVLQKIYDRKTSDAILEFGVFEGYSLSEIVACLRKKGMNNKVIGFDSFLGLPRAEPNHLNGESWRYGDYCSSLDHTKNALASALGHLNDLHLVAGIYEDVLVPSLPRSLGVEKVDLVHIDCDLVSSCSTALNFCFPLFKIGTFVIFDEWDLGEDYSWNEFAKKHGILFEVFPIQDVKNENYIIQVTGIGNVS